MSDQSNPSQGDNISEEIQAILTIVVDKEGIVQYNCDWEAGDAGLIGVASIFYRLMVDNLPAEILEEIKQQCVLNGNEGDYMAMISLINNQVSEREGDGDSDDIVIPPDQVFNI